MTNKFIEQRVEALENELSELKLIVAQIRKPSTVVEEALANDIIEFEGKQYKKVDREAREGDVVVLNDVGGSHYFETNKPYKVQEDTYIDGIGKRSGHKEAHRVYTEFYNRTPETVDVYELIVEDKPKTANQLRAEIIEKAKGFIEENLAKNHPSVYFVSDGLYIKTCDAAFHVNAKKRTIIALVHSAVDKRTIRRKGIAKCDPSDVFNEHIGKAIALGRALGLDVSEFEQAVQPTLAVGQVVTLRDGKENRTITHKNPHFTDAWYKDNKLWNYGHELNIINDTNAQYETAVTK